MGAARAVLEIGLKIREVVELEARIAALEQQAGVGAAWGAELMGLSTRLRKLEAVAPPARRGKPLPEDPVAFARAYLAGEFAFGDIDPAHPEHTGWACRLHVFPMTLMPEHQQWLRAQRELHPRAYPDDLLMPATDDEILARLDEVMRRG